MIRTARLDEIDRLRAIGIEADTRFLQSRYPGFCDGTSIPPAVAAQAIAEDRLWVATRGRLPVGWLYASRLDGEYCIGQVSVALDHGRQGLGTALLRRAHAHARELGEPSILLATQLDVPWNGPWYVRQGYEVVPQAAWTPMLLAHVREQIEGGLDWTARAFMRLRL